MTMIVATKHFIKPSLGVSTCWFHRKTKIDSREMKFLIRFQCFRWQWPVEARVLANINNVDPERDFQPLDEFQLGQQRLFTGCEEGTEIQVNWINSALCSGLSSSQFHPQMHFIPQAFPARRLYVDIRSVILHVQRPRAVRLALDDSRFVELSARRSHISRSRHLATENPQRARGQATIMLSVSGQVGRCGRRGANLFREWR